MKKAGNCTSFIQTVFKMTTSITLISAKEKKTLELFAGYGRLSNFLVNKGINVHTVELSREFSDLIELPDYKKHVGDVTTTILKEKFERIIAGYNSFCLLKENNQIKSFFRNIKNMLANDGLVSLSYYHPDFWPNAESFTFLFNNKEVKYFPEYNLSKRSDKIGIWRDRYVIENETEIHEYPVRIFENRNDLEPFVKKADLRIVGIIENYNNPKISEPGWAA